jgi:hypothetical protein
MEAKKQAAKIKKEADKVEEGWDDMLKAVKDRAGPQPSGGSGIKKGSRYGGSKQADAPEKDDDEEEKPKKNKKVREGGYYDPANDQPQKGSAASQAVAQRAAMAAAQPPKGVNFEKDYLEKAASGAPGRWMISADDAKAALAWLTANPNYKPPVGGKGVQEAAKPDYLDFDKDGNKKEPMKKALKDKKVKEDLQSGTSGAQAVRYYAKATQKVFDASNTNQQLSKEWMAYLSDKNKQDQISPRGLETSATEDGEMAMKLLKKHNIPLEDPKQPSMLDKAVSGVKGALGMKEGAGCNQTMEGKSCPVHGMKECPMEEAVKKGLYYNVNKRKKAGTSRDKDHPKAPSAQDWKNAAKTAKK